MKHFQASEIFWDIIVLKKYQVNHITIIKKAEEERQSNPKIRDKKSLIEQYLTEKRPKYNMIEIIKPKKQKCFFVFYRQTT